MKDRCANHWEGIVNLAEGRESETARLHVQNCRECAAKLEQLRAMMSAAEVRYFNAPASAIASVKGLMQPAERRVFGLLRSTTAWSGARTAAQDFQIVAGEGGTQVRLMFSKVDEGWEVMGRTPAGEWNVEANGDILETSDDGRFSFIAPRLDSTGILMTGRETELVVPSAEELLSSESNGSD